MGDTFGSRSHFLITFIETPHVLAHFLQSIRRNPHRMVHACLQKRKHEDVCFGNQCPVRLRQFLIQVRSEIGDCVHEMKEFFVVWNMDGCDRMPEEGRLVANSL
jgi:hypothetical protein